LRKEVFFFLKKKEEKMTSSVCAVLDRSGTAQTDKSFLVLFFKKELLTFP
jgi:hypothetical protein